MKRRAILFDLDGTLIDTAPDMVRALQRLLSERGRAPCDYDFARAHVSRGAVGLVSAGFPDVQEEDARAALRQRFLALYAEDLSEGSILFPGCEELLQRIEAHPLLAWGIVTNKPTGLTEPLLDALALRSRADCLVCGDTLEHRKPHPAPLLHGVATLQLTSASCIYAGDDRRDIDAARAAGMPVIAAEWGYIAPGEHPAQWGADATLPSPGQFAGWLEREGWFDGG